MKHCVLFIYIQQEDGDRHPLAILIAVIYSFYSLRYRCEYFIRYCFQPIGNGCYWQVWSEYLNGIALLTVDVGNVNHVHVHTYIADVGCFLAINDAGGYDAQQNRSTVTPIKLDVTFGNMYTKEIEAFGRAVRGACEVPVSAEDGIASQRVIEAAYATSAARTYQKF